MNGGGKLKVGGGVLVGLSRWETLVPKTKEVDQLLKNMPEELLTHLLGMMDGLLSRLDGSCEISIPISNTLVSGRCLILRGRRTSMNDPDEQVSDILPFILGETTWLFYLESWRDGTSCSSWLDPIPITKIVRVNINK